MAGIDLKRPQIPCSVLLPRASPSLPFFSCENSEQWAGEHHTGLRHELLIQKSGAVLPARILLRVLQPQQRDTSIQAIIIANKNLISVSP